MTNWEISLRQLLIVPAWWPAKFTLVRIAACLLLSSLTSLNAGVLTAQELLASDVGESNEYGNAVSVSGNIGLVGAGNQFDAGRGGAAYIFRELDTVSGIVAESVKLVTSDGFRNQLAGWCFWKYWFAGRIWR